MTYQIVKTKESSKAEKNGNYYTNFVVAEYHIVMFQQAVHFFVDEKTPTSTGNSLAEIALQRQCPAPANGW